MEREGSLAAFIWRYEPEPASSASRRPSPTSAESIALSKELKKRGWAFVGPTTVYAFMQAMGLVNDHVADCVIRAEVARARAAASPGRAEPQAMFRFACWRAPAAGRACGRAMTAVGSATGTPVA